MLNDKKTGFKVQERVCEPVKSLESEEQGLSSFLEKHLGTLAENCKEQLVLKAGEKFKAYYEFIEEFESPSKKDFVVFEKTYLKLEKRDEGLHLNFLGFSFKNGYLVCSFNITIMKSSSMQNVRITSCAAELKTNKLIFVDEELFFEKDGVLYSQENYGNNMSLKEKFCVVRDKLRF